MVEKYTEYTGLISSKSKFNMIENYLYMYHIGQNTDADSVGQFVILPTYPESITDTMEANFASSMPLSRSAPVYSYSSSGPRSMSIRLKFHREMMTQLNYRVSNLTVELGDDYVDTIIKQLQAIALPSYKAASKMVNPPQVALRFGNDIFIKGIVNGSVSVTYELPILSDNKYAQVTVEFTVIETDPYDAETVASVGSFRGLDTVLETRLYK